MSASILSGLSPELGEKGLALSKAEEAACYARVDEVFSKQTAAEAASDVANDAEHDASVALCAYRCVDMKEIVTKAEYLATIKDDLADFQYEALVASFLPLNA
jgi:hypothetical protein